MFVRAVFVRLLDASAFCLALFAVSVAQAQVKPFIQSSLAEPITTISGIADPGSKIYICTSAAIPVPGPDGCSTGGAALLTGGAGSNYVTGTANQEFTATLTAPINGLTFLYVTEVTEPVGAVYTTTPIVIAAAAEQVKPVILGPLMAGTTSLTFIGDPVAGTKLFLCTASAKPAATPPSCLAPVPAGGTQQMAVIVSPVPAADGSVTADAVSQTQTVTLKTAIAANSFLYVQQVPPGGGSTLFSPVLTVGSAVAAQEREQTDFVAGSLFSANGSNYSTASLFLAMNYDRTIWRPGWFSQNDTRCFMNGPTLVPATKAKGFTGQPLVKCNKTRHPGVNTFFQARLTTIPVNASQTVTTSGMSDSTTPTVSSFLAAQKAAQFGGGFYVPFTFGFTPRDVKDKTGAFYFAPVGRFGFSTPSGTPSGSSSTTAGATTTTTTTTTLGTANPSSGQLYNYWFAGLRAGSADLNVGALHTRQYFDVGVGKYSNLQSLACLPDANAGNPHCLTATTSTTGPTTYGGSVNPSLESRTTLLRLAFEGYLEINLGSTSSTSSSLILGISANTNPGLFPASRYIDTNNKAPEDIEFLIGYKFDVSTLLSGIPVLGK